MDVSVVIPCFNGEHYLAKTVEGIRRQHHPVREIIVVDDGSHDKTSEMAQQLNCTLIRHSHNKGLAAARNSGSNQAAHNLIAFVDADVVLQPEWLSVLLTEISKTKAVQAGGRLIEYYRRCPPDRWRVLHMPQDNGQQRVVYDDKRRGRLSGFATLIDRTALESVGRYNCMYRRSYEDIDLSYRLIDAGYHLVYTPEAVAYHFRQDTVTSVLKSSWSWDHWPEIYQGSYDSAHKLMRKLRKNIRWTREQIHQHVQAKEWNLVPIDAAMWIAFSFWDVRYFVYRRHKLLRKLLPGADLGNLGNNRSLGLPLNSQDS